LVLPLVGALPLGVGVVEEVKRLHNVEVLEFYRSIYVSLVLAFGFLSSLVDILVFA